LHKSPSVRVPVRAPLITGSPGNSRDIGDDE
jgi:hypothetical protein